MKRIIALILTLALLFAGCGSKQKAWQEHYDLGLEQLGQGNYEEAIEAFTAAIEIDPDRQEAYAQRSEAYARLARRLAQGLSDGDLEIPEIPERPEIGPGGSNPESPQETTAPLSQELPEASTPDSTYDPDEVYTHPRDEDTPDDGSNSSDSGDEDLAQKIRDLIKKLLEWAEKDRKFVDDIAPGEGDTLDEIPAYEDLVPVETEPVPDPEPDPTELLRLIDYGCLVAAMEEMCCDDVCWMVSDLDDDGSGELLLEVVTSSSGIPSQLTADADTLALFSFTPAGAAQSSCFCRYSDDSYGFYTGYHTVANQEDNYYDWDGNTWMPSDAEPVEWYTLLFGQDLWCQTSRMTLAATAASLENDFMGREGYLGSLCEDMDGDGAREYVFLIRGMTNRYFRNLQLVNYWGDEAYMMYYDEWITVVVVSESEGEVLVRFSRLQPHLCDDVLIEGDALIVDNVRYPYQSEGYPFPYGETVIADNILDLNYFQVAIPDRWEGRYAYDILENPYLDGIPERYWVTFYERQEYEASGCGVLVQIVMVLEGTDFDHPAADLMGIYYYGSPADPNCLTYSVYACYPTDVQSTEENADAYWDLSQDVYNILLSFDAGEYCYFHSYYTDTH